MWTVFTIKVKEMYNDSGGMNQMYQMQIHRSIWMRDRHTLTESYCSASHGNRNWKQ